MDFRMESNYDFVYIGDGSVLGEEFAWTGTGTTKLRVILSVNETMWFYMRSDPSVSRKGFVFYIESLNDTGKFVL